jgi:hypothetical protein
MEHAEFGVLFQRSLLCVLGASAVNTFYADQRDIDEIRPLLPRLEQAGHDGRGAL